MPWAPDDCRICPSCREKRFATAFETDSDICRVCLAPPRRKPQGYYGLGDFA